VELAPIDGIPAIGAWLGAFTSPAGKFIWAVNVGVVAGEVNGRSQAPFDGIPSNGARHHPPTSPRILFEVAGADNAGIPALLRQPDATAP
jgi:hypothetical protein